MWSKYVQVTIGRNHFRQMTLRVIRNSIPTQITNVLYWIRTLLNPEKVACKTILHHPPNLTVEFEKKISIPKFIQQQQQQSSMFPTGPVVPSNSQFSPWGLNFGPSQRLAPAPLLLEIVKTAVKSNVKKYVDIN